MSEAGKPPTPFFNPAPRQAQDVADRMRAQFSLGEDPRYYWLCDRSSIKGGKPRAWRPTLLCELGRMQGAVGKERMLELAGRLCQEQPTEKEALLQIWSAYEAGPAGALALAREIISAVEAHGEKGGPPSRQVIAEALTMAKSYLLCEDGSASEPAHEG